MYMSQEWLSINSPQRDHDLTASLLTEICHEVEVKLRLQPVTGEQDPQTLKMELFLTF